MVATRRTLGNCDRRNYRCFSANLVDGDKEEELLRGGLLNFLLSRSFEFNRLVQSMVMYLSARGFYARRM